MAILQHIFQTVSLFITCSVFLLRLSECRILDFHSITIRKRKSLLLSEFQPHCEPLGESQMQRGDPAQRWASGWDCPGVLQLWLSQCLSPGLHPGQGWLCGGATLQVSADDIMSYRGSAIPSDPVFSVLCGVSVGTVWKLDLFADYRIVWKLKLQLKAKHALLSAIQEVMRLCVFIRFQPLLPMSRARLKVQKLDVELPELGG